MTGGPDPAWNLKILPKKKVISGFWGGGGGLDPPSSVTKNYHFRWTPSHENFWIRACMYGGKMSEDIFSLFFFFPSKMIYYYHRYKLFVLIEI